MALEDLTGTKYIDSLNAANPVVADDFDKGVDHLQGIKNVLKKTFPALNGAVTATPAQLNATSTLITRSRKNLILNGSFRVWQRGDSFIPHASNEFGPDRWKYVASTTAVINSSVSNAASADHPFNYRFIASPTTADTSIAAGDYAGFIHKVEGIDCQHLQQGTTGAQTVTLSFWHAHTKAGIHTGSIRNNAIDRSYTFEYTQSVSEAKEWAEIVIPLDQSGTWLYGENEAGLILHFALAAGSTFTTTKDTWAAGNYLGTSNQVNNLDSISNYFRLADVQLEVGSEATLFERLPYAQELALCQRYYWRKNAGINTAIAPMSARNTGLCSGYITFPVTMCDVPTGALSTPTTGANWDILGLSPEALDYLAVGAATKESALISWYDTDNLLTIYNTGWLRAQTVAGYFEVDAEF